MSRERTGPVAGVVLAAGSSTRMGVNKLLLDINGESMVRHVVSRAVGGGLDPVVVVLGFEADRLQHEIEDLKCVTIVNPDYRGGMNGSFRLGLEQVPARAIAALVMLGDMPFVSEAMLRELVTRFRTSEAALVLSRYGHATAPPTIFDRSLFGRFETGDGEVGGKHVVMQNRDSAAVVDWPARALIDLDVPLDYERVKTHFAAGP